MTTEKTEHGRLKDLQSYCILDTPSEVEFDSITQLVANICDTPIATVTLIDKNREWFKSVHGLSERENDREIAFCAQAILSSDVFIIHDTLKDPHFYNNPMVVGAPHIRFYAGAPLISPDGHALGTLAIKDHKPRELTALQLQALKTLADQVMVQLETRRQRYVLETLNEERKQINLQLNLQTEHLEKEREFLSALLESLSEGIAACDEHGELSLFNRATRELHNLDQEALPPEQWAQHYDLYLADGKTLMTQAQIPLYRAYQGEKIREEELVIAPKNGTAKVIRCTGQPILRTDGFKLGAVVAMRDITEQKSKELALEKSEATLAAIFNQSYLFQGLLALDGTLTDVNDKAVVACGYTREGELGKKFWLTSWWSPDPVVSNYMHEIVEMAKQGEVIHITTDYFIASGARRKTEFVLSPIRDAQNTVVFLHASGQDVTDRLTAALELASSNRALRLLSLSNELLVRTKIESDLLAQLCELFVKVGGYEMAWVGYAHDDPEKSIKPVSHFGNFSHLKNIQPSWADNSELGRGPAGKAVRTGKPVFIADIWLDLDFAPWVESASNSGYRGVICLPLLHQQRSFGVIAMYTKVVSKVAASEIKLLQELADNLSFGIMNIRAQQESEKFHSALFKMAASVSASIDGDFFVQLTKNMAEAIGADTGLIAKLLPDQAHTLQTIAVLSNAKPADNVSLHLNPKQYALLMDENAFVLPAQSLRALAHLPIFSAQAFQCCVGQHLTDPSGQTIGLVLVLFKQLTHESNFISSLLKIFAARAGAELERLNAERHIREQASLLDKAQDAIMVRGLDNKVQFWNNGAERLYGWSREEAIGTSIETLLYPDTQHFHSTMKTLLEQGEWSGEIVQVSKFGEQLIIESHWTLVYDDHGIPQSVFTINTNITDRKAATDKIQYLAFYDPLTSLPNRTLLIDRLKHALSVCDRSHAFGALLFIDLDNFKALNDTLGHDKGDLLLQEIGDRLKSCVRDSDSVARFGGDEFVILLENVSKDASEAAFATSLIGKKVLHSLNQPYSLGNYQHQSSASIGITLFSQQDTDINELLKRADLAMYEAKAQGRNNLRFFDPKMQSEISSRVELESDLRQSLSKQQLSLHFQPQLNDKGKVVGAEALLRWQHPVRGMVPPAIFIPVAEDTKLILPIGLWVLESACAKLVDWSTHPETANLVIAVNVSECQFSQPDFVAQIFSVLDNSGANPNLLKLELTESLFAKNVDDIIVKMHQLKARGVSFSLDDFGTGYSSLTYLKSMPLDQVKIDQSFVRDVLIDPNDASIAQTIIGLANSLNLEVIAEGVETAEQREFLHQNGCYLYQGYFFSRPLPSEQFDRFIQNLR
jgi:diguanylate cyclase (GGDEF)-like protein/PAS domain S-box-containing protein